MLVGMIKNDFACSFSYRPICHLFIFLYLKYFTYSIINAYAFR